MKLIFLASCAAFVASLATRPAAAQAFDVETFSDTCSTLCEFHLCLGSDPNRPDLQPCPNSAVPDVVVRAPHYAAMPSRRRPGSLVLKLRGKRAVLKCHPVGAPCVPCANDAECFSGGQCVDGACITTALCQ
jgi:hypothetical protein